MCWACVMSPCSVLWLRSLNSFGSSRHRQRHLKGRALSGAGAFDRDLPVVQIDDALDDRKAEAGRGFTRGRLGRQPLETSEQPRNVFRRQSGPLVADLDHYTVSLASDQQVD